MIDLQGVAKKLEEAIAESDWNEAKSCLNDIWDLLDETNYKEVNQ